MILEINIQVEDAEEAEEITRKILESGCLPETANIKLHAEEETRH